MKRKLIEFYLEWVNDYLTIKKMAEDYRLHEYQCRELINIGRMLHEREIELIKASKN